MLRPLRAALLALAAGSACALAASEPPEDEPYGQFPEPPADLGTPLPYRPRAAERVVAAFDFEDHDTAAAPIPWEWANAQSVPEVPGRHEGRRRPGFPNWNRALIDVAAPARSGTGTIRLDSNGGSTALRLRPGVVGVFAGADYAVTGWVRTEGFEYARARIAAWLLNEAGERIPGSEVHATPVLTGGSWERLTAEVLGDFPDAAFLQVELQLLQPDLWAADAPPPPPDAAPAADAVLGGRVAGPGGIRMEDYRVSAWFDDVAVVQVPRIDVAVGGGSAVLRADERPGVRVMVRDLAGEPLRVVARVLDIDGREIDRNEARFDGGQIDLSWTPAPWDEDAPGPYGWFRVAAEALDAQGDRVAIAYQDFLRLPTGAVHGFAAPTGPGFGLTATALPDALFAVAADLAAAAGAGGLTLPVWREHDTPETIAAREDALEAPLRDLIAAGLQVGLWFPRAPAALARDAEIDPDRPWNALTAPENVWAPYVRGMLTRYGQNVRRWRFGPAGEGVPPGLDAAGAAYRAIARLVPAPAIELAWTAGDAPPPRGSGNDGGPEPVFAVGLSPAAVGPGLDPLVDAWTGVPGLAHVCLESPALDARAWSLREAAGQAARAALTVWASLPPRSESAPGVGFALTDPWILGAQRRPRLMPRPELASVAAADALLAGRRVTASLNLMDGVRCLLLEPTEVAPNSPFNPGAALALWAEKPTPAAPTLRLYLGDGELRLVDVFGNRTPLPLRYEDAERSALPHHEVPLSREPVYVEGVDAKLVRLISSLRVEPDRVPTTDQPHRAELVIDNPYPVTLRGKAFLLEPGGLSRLNASGGPATGRDRTWVITPRGLGFSAPPEREARAGFRIEFSPAEEAGDRDLVLDLELVGDREIGPIRVRRSLHLGLEDVELFVSYRVVAGVGGAGPRGLVVEVEVVNSGAEPISGEILTISPGLPRRSAAIESLAPGHTERRAFIYPGALEEAVGKPVYVSLELPGRGARINKSVMVE